MMSTTRDSFPSLKTLRKQTGSGFPIAVAVRVKNELAQLPAFWESLENQTIADKCERVFLDSGSSDGTLEFLLKRDCTVFSIRPEEFQFGRTCNLMMELTTAPRVVYFSGHIVLEQSDLLEKLERFFREHPQSAGYMRQVPNPATGFSRYDVAYLQRRFPEFSEYVREMGTKNSFSNAASLVCREAWESLRFLEVVGAEDHCWAQAHLSRGGKIYYFPKLNIRHSHNDSPESVFRRVSVGVEGRYGKRVMPLRAAFFFAGVFIKILSLGGGVREATAYARNHAKAYLVRSNA